MSKNEIITVYGRLGKDPELRYTKSRKAVCNFTIAEDIKGQEAPKWHQVVAWEKQAERCPVNLRKGDPVIVRGRMREHEFTGADGVLRQVCELHADFLGVSIA
tara:strand:+ start:1075 stop:1383 length:309 start_codon:yes stop_codon:yes gene_type:complete